MTIVYMSLFAVDGILRASGKLQAASHKLQATGVLTKLNNVLYRIHESKRFR